MIILDTNVVSELLRTETEPKVEKWLGDQTGAEVFLTSISEAELRYGAAIMADGKRREALKTALDAVLRLDFGGRILPFDGTAAAAYAEIAAERRAAGRPISQFDCQIAAICLVNGAAVATRNIADFEVCGIEVIDPWR